MQPSPSPSTAATNSQPRSLYSPSGTSSFVPGSVPIAPVQPSTRGRNPRERSPRYSLKQNPREIAPLPENVISAVKSERAHSQHQQRSGASSTIDSVASSGMLVVADSNVAVLPESERMVHSHREYADFLKATLSDVDKYVSPTLLCETIMKKANTESRDPAVQAAAASWCLNLLGDSIAVAKPIHRALIPALFAGYSQRSLVEQVPAGDQIAIEGRYLQQNPYMSHDFYFERYNTVQQTLSSVSEVHARSHDMMMQKSSMTKKLMTRWSSAHVGVCFRAWRGYARRLAIEHFTRRIFIRHGRRETTLITMEMCFYRWRYGVEVNRAIFLEERANTLVHQMDNAKNQFQLQCFRSDKFLRTVEELREDLSAVRDERAALKDEVKSLQRDLREHEKDTRASLNVHVNEVLQELSQWRSFARLLVDQRAARMHAVDLADKNEPESESSSSDEDATPLDTPTQTTEIAALAASVSMNVGPAADHVPEHLLLRWCSNIVRNSVVSQVTAVKNFTTDFQSGEVLVLVMHHVFPSRVPFTPLQEANLQKRYEQIIELAKTVGISYLVRTSDIREGMGDVMLLTVTELFLRYAAKQRSENKAATVDASQAPTVHYDAEMMHHVLAETQKEMSRLKAEELAIEGQEASLSATEEMVLSHASHFSRQRLLGTPVEILDPKELGRYTRFNPARFQDIAFKYKRTGPEVVLDKWVPFPEQLKLLKKALKIHFHDMRRVFKFYSGNAGTMTDVDFWRLCADIRIFDKGTVRGQIDRIFTIANSEDIPQDEDEDGVGGADDDGEDEENPATELIPSEFVECLIRMADLKVQGGKMIQERFLIFMQTYVLINACKSDADRFKKEIYTDSTQIAVKRYMKDLTKVFQHYGIGKGKKKVMDEAAFLSFCHDAHVGIDEKDQKATFSNVLGVGVGEMAQHDFFEAVVCIAAFKTSSPFLGLDRKVDIAVTLMISTLRGKLKGHGTILTDMKPVSLAAVTGTTSGGPTSPK